MEINGIELKFGMSFIRELNKKLGMWTAEGVNLGMSLQRALPGILAFDAEAISTVLYCATVHLKKSERPTQAQIDEYLENVEDFEKLVDELIEALKESSITNVSLKKLMDNLPTNE